VNRVHGFALAWLAALSTSAFAQGLDAKLGLWQVSSTTETSGRPPIPPEVLAKMPPERRAQMESAMKAREAKGPRTTTHKTCFTQKDRERAFQPRDDDENRSCKRTIVSQSARKMEVRIDCSGERQSTGQMTIEAMSQESVKGAFDMKVTRGDDTMQVKSSFTGKWIGADCGEHKRN